MSDQDSKLDGSDLGSPMKRLIEGLYQDCERDYERLRDFFVAPQRPIMTRTVEKTVTGEGEKLTERALDVHLKATLIYKSLGFGEGLAKRVKNSATLSEAELVCELGRNLLHTILEPEVTADSVEFCLRDADQALHDFEMEAGADWDEQLIRLSQECA